MTLCVITGANRGIGLEIARQAAEKGHQVLALCRRASEDLKKLDVEIAEGIELKDSSLEQRVVDIVGGRGIGHLINNAGILRRETLEAINADSIREQFEVNALAPLRVVGALKDSMASGSKVVLITSRMGSIGDNTSGSRYGYRMSKAALNMAGASLAKDLEGSEIAVGIIHPGFVQTEMTAGSGHVTAAESAANIWNRIDGVSLSNSGSFWHAEGQILPW